MCRSLTLTGLAVLLLAAGGVTIAAASGSENDHDGAVEVIHVVEETPPGGNVALDLDHSGGSPPDTVGDQLAFRSDLLVGGHKIGFNGGVCQLVGLPALFQCVASDSLPGGQLTVQGINDFSQGNGPFHFAITGGTGRYRKAHGEVEFLLNTPDANHVQATIRIVR
jgi:hypothetical protein